MLSDLTIKKFLAQVAGSDPVPGGGSIAALSGALASALATMVANLTVGKKGYESCEYKMKEVLAHTLGMQRDFTLLIDKDSEAYEGVFACFKMPKITPEEKADRSIAIQLATKQAALVPMEVAEKALQLMPLIQDVAKWGNRNAVTDACVAMMSARLAVLGALLNVRINLNSIRDKEFVNSMQKKADEMEKSAYERENNLLVLVNKDLRV
jgi:formiminotetrahydrofolate cyclodeaminase